MSRYVEVPSNTKVDTFKQFVLSSPALTSISEPALGVYKVHSKHRGAANVCYPVFQRFLKYYNV